MKLLDKLILISGLTAAGYIAWENQEVFRSYLPTVTKVIERVQNVEVFRFGIKRYSQEEIRDLLYKYAGEYEIHPVLVMAIAHTESRFQQMRQSTNEHVFQRIKRGELRFPKAWSEELQDDAGKRMASGAIGVMQVMPHTAAYTAAKLGIELPSMLNLFDADLNIKIGCAYLKECIKESRGSFDKVAACYNGPGHMKSGWSDSVVTTILDAVVKGEV